MHEATVIALFAVCAIAMVAALAAWVSVGSSYWGMYINRSERATLGWRLLPWWWVLDGMLTERGSEWRTHFWRGVLLFLLSAAVFAAAGGAGFLLHYEFGWDVSLKL